MKKIKSFTLIFLITIVAISSLTSCMTTKTSVGEYRQIQGNEYTYARGKQLWLFWGLLPLGRTDVSTPNDGNCQVVTRYTFVDFLISGLTGGILTSYTIKVKAKK